MAMLIISSHMLPVTLTDGLKRPMTRDTKEERVAMICFPTGSMATMWTLWAMATALRTAARLVNSAARPQVALRKCDTSCPAVSRIRPKLRLALQHESYQLLQT